MELKRAILFINCYDVFEALHNVPYAIQFELVITLEMVARKPTTVDLTFPLIVQ